MDKEENKDKQPKKKYETNTKVNTTFGELSKLMINAKPKKKDGGDKK